MCVYFGRVCNCVEDHLSPCIYCLVILNEHSFWCISLRLGECSNHVALKRRILHVTTSNASDFFRDQPIWSSHFFWSPSFDVATHIFMRANERTLQVVRDAQCAMSACAFFLDVHTYCNNNTEMFSGVVGIMYSTVQCTAMSRTFLNAYHQLYFKW